MSSTRIRGGSSGSRRVGIVLVRRGLTWLRLDVERAVKTDLSRDQPPYVKKRRGDRARVSYRYSEALRSLRDRPRRCSPNHQVPGCTERLLDRAAAAGEDVEVWRSRAALSSEVGEEAGDHQRSFLSFRLFLFEFCHDGFERPLDAARSPSSERCRGRASSSSRCQFSQETRKRRPWRLSAFSVEVVPSSWAFEWFRHQRIGQFVAHYVPVGCSETKMIFHRFAIDDLIGIIVLKGKWVLRAWALE